MITILKLSMGHVCLVSYYFSLWGSIPIEKLTLCFAYCKNNPNKAASLLPLPVSHRLDRVTHSGFQTTNTGADTEDICVHVAWRLGLLRVGPDITTMEQQSLSKMASKEGSVMISCGAVGPAPACAVSLCEQHHLPKHQ